MMDKVLGSAIVVMASGKIGYDTANKYKKRVKEIQAFQSGLWGIKSNISFCRSTMAESMEQASKLIPTKAAKVFADTAQALNSNGDVTAATAWHQALADNEEVLALRVDELSVLYAFGSSLGTSDALSEIENIESAIEKLKICEESARTDEKKYGNMCRGLGVLCGIFLSLIFI